MRSKTILAAAAAALVAVTAGQAAAAPLGVPHANHRAGHPPNRLLRGLALRQIAAGPDPLENPSGPITTYGFLNDAATQPVEATKTEPDQNTYLAFPHGLPGPTAGYDYGRHFLFQPHEGTTDDGYVTRINLDVRDPAHRITLLTPAGGDGLTHLNALDGSTWDPFTRTLLFTQENGPDGGVIELTPGWPPHQRGLDGVLGKGSYEGIHPDGHGNLLIIEDEGGTDVPVDPSDPASPVVARQPNSFVYRFVPANRRDLAAGGVLQALQVRVGGRPVVFHPGDPVGDTFSVAQKRLHTPGTSWPARWVTVHDTASDGSAPFDANAAAKAAGATPFKRPENAQFQPGTGFSTFYFDPTGDTNADSGHEPALAARGAWGSIFRVHFGENGRGRIAIAVLGDAIHSSFDNLAFATPTLLLAAEDRGDTLHAQLNRLDSVWAYDVRHPGRGVRVIALGRDRASQRDAALLDAGTPGYQNEGDNEPTGLHVSAGRIDVDGLQGTLAALRHARAFITQQHGLNRTFEILRRTR